MATQLITDYFKEMTQGKENASKCAQFYCFVSNEIPEILVSGMIWYRLGRATDLVDFHQHLIVMVLIFSVNPL